MNEKVKKVADKAHRLTDEKLEEMERHLSAIYSRAKKEVGKTWTQYMKEAAKELEELQEAYDLAKKSGDKDEIKRTGKALGRAKREVTIKNRHYKTLTESLAREIAHVNETAVSYINDQLPEVYALNYNALKESVDGVGGYVFELVDADTVKHLALTDKSLLPYKKLDLRKDIPWNMKKINSEVLQGIIQGEGMDKIAKRIGNVQEMNKNASIRTARTIVTGAENKGRFDSYQRATDDGIILKEEWISTNDSRTRHSHAIMDGETKGIDGKFSNGLAFPGDPNGEPSEVYNCRCTMAARVLGFKKVKR